MEVIGWIGGILLSICGIPQAWKCYKTKTADGLSGWFLLTWLHGEILTLVYVLSKGWDATPLILNYILNLVAILIILVYAGKDVLRERDRK